MDEAKSEILELNHYYPFGMRMAMQNSKKLANQHYLYNGKEKQEETAWLDYGWRMLDISLGRWMCLDPLAEEYTSYSPYNYCINNPLRFIDPNGMWADWFQDNNGNQTWFDSSEESFHFNGIKYSNIGKTNSVYNEGTGFVNFYQNIAVSVSQTKIDIMGSIINNPRRFGALMNKLPSKYSNSLFESSVSYGINHDGVNTAMAALSVPVLTITGLSGGVATTSLWGLKGGISLGSRLIIDGRKVDLFDTAADAFLAPGAGSILGGFVDITPFAESKFGYYGDGKKSLNKTSIDIVTGFYPGSIGGKIGNSLSPYLQNTTEKMLSESIISMPFGISGLGVNKSLKKIIYE
jgi:RHS repeat-associated protein